jgi:soluble lytic murein transglycosylase-like protein
MTRDEIITYVRANAGADAALALGIISEESMFRADAFADDHNGGSYGLGQLNLATARDRGYTGDAAELFDPVRNILLTLAQIAWIRGYLGHHGIADTDSVIAAYNEGVGNVVKGIADPQYVTRVTGYMKEFEV